MRIGIIGNGVVGSATGAAFEGRVDEVRYWDVLDHRCTHSLHDTVCGTDLVFVCLPTPQQKDSLACDITAVDEFFCYMGELSPKTNYVLRSTVPIGTTRMLREKYGLVNLVHSPEFLTARTAKEDAANPTRMVIGRCEGNTHCALKLFALYKSRWSDVRVFHMTSDESEAVKLFQNSYSAVVIATLNEFRCLADKKGMDWGRVISALIASGWLAPRHINVPGHDGKRGFGGSCLPKDLANLIQCMCEQDDGYSVCRAAYMRNRDIDRKEEQ
jgi:nucleotide sugar dehydrogenase